MKFITMPLSLAALLCMGLTCSCASGPTMPNSVSHLAETQPAGPVLFAGKTGKDWESYQAMHSYYIDRFVQSRGFGLSRIANPAFVPEFWSLYIAGVRYHVGALQLISLNDGNEPFAYVIDSGMPMTTDLGVATKHRPLSEAESDALEKLKSGDEIVWSGKNDHPVLIGAVRAMPSCVKCHSVPEGTLLGAFNYPLTEDSLFAKQGR